MEKIFSDSMHYEICSMISFAILYLYLKYLNIKANKRYTE